MTNRNELERLLADDKAARAYGGFPDCLAEHLRNNAPHYLSLVEENARLRRERYDICQNKRINDAIQTALEKGEITLCGEGYMIPLGEPK